ncbi:MAG: LysR family transcriptional regulator [Pseudomonadota bacterium]|nr:LysR family transcriptional regulator [Pseudomonadota bacterium]
MSATWQGVTEFVAVADHQSFTKAAQQLGLSTAHVSRQVRMLEERLGIDLLHRTTRRVGLTEAGQLYYQQCQPLLEGLQHAEEAVNELRTTPRGRIRLTAPVHWSEQHLAPVLNAFLHEYPEIALHCELTNQKLDVIHEGIDLAIRLGTLDNPQLIARQLGERRLHVCASPDYLNKHGVPRVLADLAQHDCLLGTYDYWRFYDGEERIIKLSSRLRCNSGNALLDAALRGLGIVQLPDYYVADALEDGRLIEVLTEFMPKNEGIWALYPPGRNLSPKVRVLLDYLSEKFADDV